jgi:predicted N-acyltransferase
MNPSDFDLAVSTNIDSIKKHDWDQLTLPDFPFHSFEFLKALEESGSLNTSSVWAPQHLTLSSGNTIVGATQLYKKTDSYGEYIFDWSWAKAYHQHGIPYFPKLTSAAPFTPATGPKILLQNANDQEAIASALIKGALDLMVKQECSSLHYLFITEKEIPIFAKDDFLIRHSFQYHWENKGFSSFDDFLATMKTKKRKQIIRERSQLKEEGLEFKVLTGDDLKSEHADVFYGFYLNTIEKMQAIPYLNKAFYRQVFSTMKNNVILMLAKEHGEPIAGALYFTGGKKLFGRYWGASKEVRNLHFELCYYLPIEWSIKQGIELFEAGAQGEHKIARGFVPRKTYSAHFIRHPGFRSAIAEFIEQEKKGIENYFADLSTHSPFNSP